MKYITATMLLLTTVALSGVVTAVVPTTVFAQQSKLVPCEGPDDCKFEQLVELGANVVEFLFELATAIAVIVLAYAGFLYMTAAGNTGKISQAHQLIWYAVIGFLVALSAWLLVEVLMNTLQIDPQFKPSGFR